MNIEGKRFAVLGGAGFIGSHVVDKLAEAGAAHITVLDNFSSGCVANVRGSAARPVTYATGDVRRGRDVAGALDCLDKAIDGVFLLAAAWLLECTDHPREALSVNVQGTLTVAEACIERGIPLVFSSSASVYGEPVTRACSPIRSTVRVTEHAVSWSSTGMMRMAESHPFNNRNFYGATKIAGEQMLRALHTQRGLHYTALRYANVYGPRQSSKNEFVGVVQRMFDRAEAGEPIQISGDGSQAFDFVYVEDVARANRSAMNRLISDKRSETEYAGDYKKWLANDECFNVGTGVGTTLVRLAEKIALVAGAGHPFEFVKSHKPGLVSRRVLDCSKAVVLGLGDNVKVWYADWWKSPSNECPPNGGEAKVGLDEGLRLYHEWRRGQKGAVACQE